MGDYVMAVGTISKRVLIPAQRGAIPVWIEYAIYYSDQLHVMLLTYDCPSSAT